ncbi:uncharacterized protein (TIGR03083 family) [Prauserella shujinwangii]|uniref:Uncharacterized protein (TIGR03083 family) n=1 Tax=Prauserella shujinwangii TaxID=1453103 RepID=A0A2T0LN60_9PSEU|nr:maleylpyruvate isomerase family mycothiol-dependent enzyme [Prauserella shujinwangii]PRX44541.1 uncharacterized protein (TIGR03083 family) [Prauserella shujinwangii]
MDLMTLATQERADLAAFLGTLEPAEWDAPTLCSQWRVRDVVAHVISYDDLAVRALLRRLARGRFALDRANAIGVSELAGLSPDALLGLLDRHLRPRGLTAAFGGMVGLVDGMIHHQDIRRALGRPREIPAERLLPALRRALIAPPIGAIRRARGLRLVATDHEWSHGRGPEVRGKAEAILMAVAGRGAAVPELSGPGQRILAARAGVASG